MYVHFHARMCVCVYERERERKGAILFGNLCRTSIGGCGDLKIL